MVIKQGITVTTAPIPIATGKYISELDGIRAVAVLFVVFAHYRILPYLPGAFGVTLFFFLSGYLITTLFFSEHRSTFTVNIPKFYMRRWLRLTPPLVISVVFGIVFYRVSRIAVEAQPVPTGTAMAALFYYTNYYDLFWKLDPNKVIPFGICWSLAVEEHFYLIWPWIVRRNIINSRGFCLLVTGLCVGVLVWRIAVRYILVLSDDYTYMSTDCRIDSILYGALLRVLFESSWASGFVVLLRTRMVRILALLAILVTFMIRDENFRQTFRYSIQGIALMPFFTAVLSDDPNTLLRRALSHPPMVLIGRLSYSIYLFHLLARTPGEVYFGSPYQLGSVISGLLLTGGVSYALFLFVERPIAGLRHRFRADARSARALRPLTEGSIITPQERTPGV